MTGISLSNKVLEKIHITLISELLNLHAFFGSQIKNVKTKCMTGIKFVQQSTGKNTYYVNFHILYNKFRQ